MSSFSNSLLRSLDSRAVLIAVASLAALVPGAPAAVLTQSDVVFMYQASRGTYDAYGATVLAWGGAPNPKAREEAKGVRWFGSVGMVTEFNSYHKRFPDTYEQGLCRDLEGNPIKVPWLTDHKSQGVPYWWCCTQQPLFRQFLQERVAETLKAGADGLHIDDHLGTSGGLWLGICFCDRCVQGFVDYLKKLPADERTGLPEAARQDGFNFRDEARQWIASSSSKRKVQDHPLWPSWTAYQHRAAAAFMMELRDLAARTAGHPVPVGANAGLLWPGHLSDYKAIDLFSAETDHHAASRRFSDSPLVAYRMAEAMERPYAATASGQDWAFIKEQNLPGLVRGWIALSYAAGQRLMAPHRQWCYTTEKGTHWYEGPAERFAPLYQFVKRNAGWLDGFETHSDLAIVLPHGAYRKNSGRWMELCNRLAATNMSYTLEIAGDDLVEHPLTAARLERCSNLLIPDRKELLASDQAVVEGVLQRRKAFTGLEEALASMRPAVRVLSASPVRALPRVKPGAAVIHVLNYSYDATRDDVVPLEKLTVNLDLKVLGVAGAAACRWITPESEGVELRIAEGAVEVPRLGLWGMLAVERP